MVDVVGAVRGVYRSGEERAEALVVFRVRRRERQAPVRAPVERAVEGDDVLASRVAPRQLDRRLHRLGPGVREERLRRPHRRRDPVQAGANL